MGKKKGKKPNEDKKNEDDLNKNFPSLNIKEEKKDEQRMRAGQEGASTSKASETASKAAQQKPAAQKQQVQEQKSGQTQQKTDKPQQKQQKADNQKNQQKNQQKQQSSDHSSQQKQQTTSQQKQEKQYSNERSQSQQQSAWGGSQGPSAWGQQQTPQQQPKQSWGGQQQTPREQSQPQTQSGWGRGQQQQTSYEQPQQQTQSGWGRGQQQPTQSGWGRGQQQQQQQSSWGQQQQQQRQRHDSNQSTTSQQSNQSRQSGWGQQQQSSRDQPQQQQQQQRRDSNQSSASQQSQQSRPQSTRPTTSNVKQEVVNPNMYKKTDITLAKGTKGRKIKLEVNYLQLIIDKMIDSAYHYNITFDPDKPRRFLRTAFYEYCKKVNLPNNIKLAFDGKCNVYSPIKLENKYLTTVDLVAADSLGSKEFKVSLQETIHSEIDLKCLKTDYKNLQIYEKPQRALQCLDIVLRSPCYDKAVLAGRAFYNAPPRRIDLTEGYELWYGLFQAAVLGERPLLNIDICHRSFPSGMKVIDILRSFDTPRYKVDLSRELDRSAFGKLNTVLSDLNVIYSPPASFNALKKRYRVNSVTQDSAQRLMFDCQGRNMSVADYFKFEKKYALQYPHLPCLWVGSREKKNYLPIELVELEAGQYSLKKAGPMQIRNMIRLAATSTNERKQKIMSQYDRFEHHKDPTINAFKIQIAKEFVQLEGRIIDAPTLKYSNEKQTIPRDGKWDPFRSNLNFIDSKTSTNCAILGLDSYINDIELKKFADSFKSFTVGGLRLDFVKIKKSDPRNLDRDLNDFKRDKIELIFVVLPGRPGDKSYAAVKKLAETKYGLLTQCIKSDTVSKKINASTIQNIALKVNAKLNGRSHIIDRNRSLLMPDAMFIGADVTHPSPDQKRIPSVVGVAASHDLNGMEYNIQWRLQDPKKEIIQNMEDILEAHLKMYQKKNNTLPKNIIYYRDGVSDGQFQFVKDEELKAFDRACTKFREKGQTYRPSITCVIVQKRHRTRFFPKEQGIGKFNNVPPGTIVDHYITHPNECQFFIVSHESIQGTAKPTKYVVIRDDHKFNIDDLQSMTHNLCHMFTRCNRAVSYPAPAYYAHLVAYRGRVYIEDERSLNLNRLDNEYQNRKIKFIDETNPMFFV